MARIKVSSAKAKGRNLQQWVCARISEITGYPWGSSGDDHPIESRPMGQSGTDVRMESHVLKLFPFSIECKAQETWNLNAFISQATTNILPNTHWLLVCKKSRQNPVVIMALEDFNFWAWSRFDKISCFQRYFIQNTWPADKWIEYTKDKTKHFKKENWLITFGHPEKEERYVMMDGMLFFDLFDKAPMKRTK